GNLLTDRAGPAGCLARDTVLAAALGQLEPAARATSAPDAAVQVHSRGLGGVEADAAESRDRDEMLTDGQGVLLGPGPGASVSPAGPPTVLVGAGPVRLLPECPTIDRHPIRQGCALGTPSSGVPPGAGGRLADGAGG